jgi:hypothetical protein
MSQRLRFDPGALRVTVQQFYVLGGMFGFRHGITAELRYADGIDGMLARIDEASAESLSESKHETARWLATPSALTELTIPAVNNVTSLSQLVELWAAKAGREVVMELAPLRESIDL